MHSQTHQVSLSVYLEGSVTETHFFLLCIMFQQHIDGPSQLEVLYIYELCSNKYHKGCMLVLINWNSTGILYVTMD